MSQAAIRLSSGAIEILLSMLYTQLLLMLRNAVLR